MNSFALHHFPERDGLMRWSGAALAIVLMHVAFVGAIVVWYTRAPPAPSIIPAIAVSLAPVTSAPEVQEQDVAIGQPMQQAEPAPPPEPPKVEQQPLEQTPPPPPQPKAEVTLPKPQPPKPVEQKKPVERRPPAPETRAAPKSERIAPPSVAGSTAYNSLVFGHLQRFKRYPAGADGASGTAVVRFTLSRSGQVLSSSLMKSSGNAALDREALDILHRASPFPPFPQDKPAAQDSFAAPISFAQR